MTEGVATPVDYKRGYTDWLPNANVNVHFGRDVILRLAATRTRTRPTFQQLNPRLALAPPVIGCNPQETLCVRTGSGGNPFLNPLRSTNFDASLEYYFSPSGYAAVGAFYRDMSGFVLNQIFTYPDPDPVTGYPIEISAPVNSGKSRIAGVEAQVHTFFDFDGVPAGCGPSALKRNVTYIDAKGRWRQHQHPDFKTCPRGPSTWSACTSMGHSPPAFHTTGGRLTPKGRSIRATSRGTGARAPRLDFSSSYTVTPNLTFVLRLDEHPQQAVQVRHHSRQLCRRSADDGRRKFPMVVRYEESILSGGIRFRWGREAPPPPPPAVELPPPPPPPPAVEPAPPPPPPRRRRRRRWSEANAAKQPLEIGKAGASASAFLLVWSGARCRMRG